jgi:hypothetical protein
MPKMETGNYIPLRNTEEDDSDGQTQGIESFSAVPKLEQDSSKIYRNSQRILKSITLLIVFAAGIMIGKSSDPRAAHQQQYITACSFSKHTDISTGEL